jgi:hypothetical protein
LQRLEAVLDVRLDALVQSEEFLVNLMIAAVGLEEFHILDASFAKLADLLARRGDPDGLRARADAAIRRPPRGWPAC